jgi:ribosomal protein S18 acetylase RimI-like enzyme
MDVRDYRPSDDEQREELQLRYPVAPGASACRRFRRLVAHAEMYDHSRTFVAEHEGKVVGIISAALKCVYLQGEPSRVGYLFDLRVSPGARGQGVGSALYAHAESVMRSDGAAATYSIIMAANTLIIPLTRRFGLAQAGLVETLAGPVRQRQPVRAEVTALRSAASIVDHVNPYFAEHDLFVPGLERYPALGKSVRYWAQTGSSFAAVTQSVRGGDFEEVVQPRPVWAAAVRGLLCVLSISGPVPAIPVREQLVCTWLLGEPVIAGPDGERLFRDVVSHINNLALENGVDWLLLPLAKSDPLRGSIRRAFFARRLCPMLRPFLTIRARLLTKPFTGTFPARLRQIYLDTRDF